MEVEETPAEFNEFRNCVIETSGPLEPLLQSVRFRSIVVQYHVGQFERSQGVILPSWIIPVRAMASASRPDCVVCQPISSHLKSRDHLVQNLA